MGVGEKFKDFSNQQKEHYAEILLAPKTKKEIW